MCDLGLDPQPFLEADAAALGGEQCEGAGRGADGGLLAAFHCAVLDRYGNSFGNLRTDLSRSMRCTTGLRSEFYVASAALLTCLLIGG